jgi:hypothetical protein
MDNDDLLIAIKDMFDKKVDEVKHHTELLIENLHDDIKSIAEGHSGLDRKIDHLHDEIVEINRDLRRDMMIVKDYVIKVDEKLNEHEIILKKVK